MSDRLKKLAILDVVKASVMGYNSNTEFLSSKPSLLNKIEAEIKDVKRRYTGDKNVIRMPSMAMISITHERSDTPISLFGTDIKANNIVAVTIYHASQDRNTFAIKKEGVLAEFRMSETQFGKMICNPNCGTGYPATLNAFREKAVLPYNPANDYTKQEMTSLIDEAQGNMNQVDRFIRTVESIIDKGKEKGRLSKTDIGEIEKYMSMLVGHAISNGAHTVSQINRKLIDSVNEASLNIHLAINDLMIGHTKLALEKKDEGVYSSVSLSFKDELTFEENQLMAEALSQAITADSEKELIENHALSEYEAEKAISILRSYSKGRMPRRDPLTQDSHIMVSVMNRSGAMNLFDYPEENSSAFVFKISTAEHFKSSDIDDNKFRHEPSSGSEMLEVALSPEQYIRAMRSESIEIPCTVLRSHGDSHQAPPRVSNMLAKLQMHLKDDLASILSDVSTEIKELILEMPSGTISGKKKIDDLASKVSAVIENYKATYEDQLRARDVSMTESAEYHLNTIKANIEVEVKKLPPEKQRDGIMKLMPIVEALRLD